jgi:hypothetical protein
LINRNAAHVRFSHLLPTDIVVYQCEYLAEASKHLLYDIMLHYRQRE